MATKGNVMRESKAFLIAAQNNTIRTSYFKAKIDKTKKNSKCKLCGNRRDDQPHNKRMQQQEHMTRHNWELCKKFKFDHTNKWSMHNPESVLKNEMHKPFWNFEIQTDHLISIRRRDLVKANEKENRLTTK